MAKRSMGTKVVSCAKIIIYRALIAACAAALAFGMAACSNGEEVPVVYVKESVTNSGTWTDAGSAPLKDAGNIHIAYGKDKFVAVGDNGQAAYSEDGETWMRVKIDALEDSANIAITYGEDAVDNSIAITNGGDASGKEAAAAKDKFVAVGSDGKAAYSSDGVEWTDLDIKKTSDFGKTWTSDGTILDSGANIDIIYGYERFMAVGGNGKIAFSDDGINWTQVSISALKNSTKTGIAYGKDYFVAVGSDGNASYSKTGGRTWPKAKDTAALKDIGGADSSGGIHIACGGDKFLAVGDKGYAAYSDDNGKTWIRADDILPLNDSAIAGLAYGDGKFVAVGENGNAAYSSDNGITWEAAGIPALSDSAKIAITYGAGKFAAVDDNGNTACWVTP